MILLVLDDPDRLAEVLFAWESAGAMGATIIESTGLHRRKRHLAMRYSFDTGIEEEGHVTLFAMVPDLALVERCLAATEAVVGDLDGPDTGVFAAWPVAISKGVSDRDDRA